MANIFILASCILLALISVFAEDIEAEVPRRSEFVPPHVPSHYYFAEFFTSPNDLSSKWLVSQAKKSGVDEALSKYDGQWSVEVPESSAILNDYALVLKSRAKHHAVSSKLKETFDFSQESLVVQYEVKFQNGLECGGAYVKLLSSSLDLNNFNDVTPYTIMFGPDKCGLDNKIHFIFRHKNPKTGNFDEKHAKKVSQDIDKYFSDKKTHLYTLVVHSDNRFEIYVDQSLVNSGSLFADFTPSVNPEKEIDDPNDKKPEEWEDKAKILDQNEKKPDDWDENAPEFILDENAVKPEGWLDNESSTISDPDAVKPSDWDPELDGDWEAPKIDNPKCSSAPGCGEWQRPKIRNTAYKGKWSPPLIDNPAYKGVWKPRRIPNPDYFEDLHPFQMTPFSAIGLELWSMTEGVTFDNFLIVDNKKDADNFASETWIIKREAERVSDPNTQSVVDAIREAINEKPWIIALVCIAFILPVIFIFIYLCRSPKPSTIPTSEHYLAAQRKKTDAPTSDDAHDLAQSQTRDVIHPSSSESGASSGEESKDADDEEVKNGERNSPKPSPKKSATSAGGDVTTETIFPKSSEHPDSDHSDIDNQEANKQVIKKRRPRKEN